MKNVKMKTKLILGFFVPILLTVINSAIGVWSTRHTVSTVEGMYEAEYQTVVEKLAEIGADEEKGDILLDAIASEITNSVTSLKTVATELNAISIALIVISVIITLIIALSIIKSIMVSIRELSGAAKDIAMGRVDIDLIKHGNDEFGELVDDYKEVISNIKSQAQIAEEVSHGNLTVTVTPKSPEDLLGNSLKKLVEDNLTTLSNISDAGTQVTISSSQVASASQALAQGSTEQASAIEEITASIDEIADKTKQNAEQANEAAGLVLHAIEDVKKGNQQMEDMVNAMQDINQSSESISKIIKTIDDIAFQTNILALNAAVEAARAGEAGNRLYTRLLASFLKTMEKNSVETDFDETDCAETIEKAHAIKGTAGNLSITPLYESYAEILTLLRGGNTEKAREILKEILPGQEQIINCIKKHM